MGESSLMDAGSGIKIPDILTPRNAAQFPGTKLMQAKLTVGFLLDSTHVSAWQFALMQRVASSDYASVDVLVLSNPAPSSRGTQSSLFDLFGRFRRHELKRQQVHPDACAHKNIADLHGNIKVLSLPVQASGVRSQIAAASAHEVLQHGFDVVIALGGLAIIDELSAASKLGVWYYEHSSDQTGRVDGTSVAFWEVIKRQPCVWSRLLVRQAGLPGDRIACESYSGVHHLSHGKSRNEHLWKITSFVPRMLQRLHAHGSEHFLAYLRDAPISTRESSRGNRGQISDARLLFPLVAYVAWRLIQKIIRRLHTDRWILMYSTDGNGLAPRNLKKLLPPGNRFWADPFVIFRAGRYHVFFEDASLETGHGRLSVVTMDERKQFSSPIAILERTYHLSYPFVFEWQGSLYLIPESADNRTVELYRCLEFPHQWIYQQNLMEGLRAYDSTLLEYEGIWWLFAAVKEQDGASSWDELCLFYADNPLSTSWRPHPMNPVVSDVRSARPAGRIYKETGRIYRPSQDSSLRYGYALKINEILELTKTSYREQLIETIEPNWDRKIRGIHTYNRAGHLTLVDAFHRMRRVRGDVL